MKINREISHDLCCEGIFTGSQQSTLVTWVSTPILDKLSLMIGLLLISRMINQFKFISSSRLSRWTKKTGITG